MYIHSCTYKRVCTRRGLAEEGEAQRLPTRGRAAQSAEHEANVRNGGVPERPEPHHGARDEAPDEGLGEERDGASGEGHGQHAEGDLGAGHNKIRSHAGLRACACPCLPVCLPVYASASPSP